MKQAALGSSRLSVCLIKVPQRDWLRQLGMSQNVFLHCIRQFLLKYKFTIKLIFL